MLWVILAIFASSSLFTLHPSKLYTLSQRFNIFGISGGVFGWLLASQFIANLFGQIGATILATAILASSVFMFIGITAIRKWGILLGTNLRSLNQKLQANLDARRDRLEKINREEREIARQRALLEKSMKKEQVSRQTTHIFAEKRQASVTTAQGASSATQQAALAGTGRQELLQQVKSENRDFIRQRQQGEPITVNGNENAKKQKRISTKDTAGEFPAYKLPSLDLLQPVPPAKERAIHSDIHTTARILQETLAEFGIESQVTNIEQGPVVTRYELLPAPGIRIEKIAQLSNNLALTLKATSVRVQAQIPGKGVVGIEVPNTTSSLVYLREILESKTWQSTNATIPIILGKDVSGNDIVADLTIMPHLLIAGATGSGKTVCINSILAGMLMCKRPDQLRLMLIDPKIVEFSVYADLPHLIVPIITDAKKVPLGLRWAINEMEKRYRLFASVGVRTIQAYNSRPTVEPKASPEKSNAPDEFIPPTIPYIVIVIDELADLMLIAQADIENAIARLAQLSRAVGIHMILATQRPSVNIITGTIKANFPARVSFQVAQKVDSRTILDSGGADKLLGRGDMLILPPGTNKLIRAQGALTTDKDINSIVQFIKNEAKPRYELTIAKSIGKAGSAQVTESEDEDTELLEAAIDIMRQAHRASVSLLQRRLKIGYNRAGRLMDILEEKGIVGPPHGSDPREILIDLNGEISLDRQEKNANDDFPE